MNELKVLHFAPKVSSADKIRQLFNSLATKHIGNYVVTFSIQGFFTELSDKSHYLLSPLFISERKLRVTLHAAIIIIRLRAIKPKRAAPYIMTQPLWLFLVIYPFRCDLAWHEPTISGRYQEASSTQSMYPETIKPKVSHTNVTFSNHKESLLS